MIFLTLLITFFSSYAVGQTLSLQDAIRLAQEHSYGIKSSRYDSAAASYDYKAAVSQRYPTLSLSASSIYVNNLLDVNLGFRPIQLGTHENYQADFKLSVPLFTGGRLSNQIGILKENREAKSFSLEAEKLSAAYQSRRAYLNLLYSQSLAGASKASLERITIIRKDVQNLYDNGMADSVDVLDAELAYQKALQLQEQNLNIQRNSSLVLARQIGWPSDNLIMPTDSVPSPTAPEQKGSLPDSTMLNRPELKVFDHQIRTADLAISLNKAGYFPTLSAVGGYSVGKPNRDQFDKIWDDYFSAGLVLSWDFNLGGKTRNNILSAKQTSYSARMSKSQLTEALTTQAGAALQNLQYSYKAYQLTKSQYDVATREYKLARDKERAGQLSVNRLLEMEADLTSSEEMYHASMINYFLAETEYFYAVGAPQIYGGF